MGGNGRGSWKLKRVAKKIILLPCTSLCSSSLLGEPPTTSSSSSSSNLGPELERPSVMEGPNQLSEMGAKEADYAASVSSKNLCAICLEPLLNNNTTSSPGKAIFTSQCSHSFHLSCISSNIRHGNITCPICRAQWTRLPRTLHPPCWLSRNQHDPIIRILDDSISTFRVHRRSFVHTARYNDDDPVEPEARPRFCFTLIPLDVRLAYLSVRLAPQQAIDLVLVVSPNGPHLRLLKQSMALVLSSLRPVDRLAIVSYSSAAARIFPLRRMTPYGKRAALQVVDRLFYAGHADPTEGIKKGVKILKDRAHENPLSSILHLSDYPIPTSSSIRSSIMEMQSMPFSLHQFHVSNSSGSIMHELEEFLGQLLGGVVQEVQLRIGVRVVRLGELRGDEERRVVVEMEEPPHDHVCIDYSYVEGGIISVGEVVVAVGEGAEEDSNVSGGRTSCADSWDYHDPFVARRWAKRLHGGGGHNRI